MEKMRIINIDLDDDLMGRAMRTSGAKTKKELVNNALRYYRDILRKERQEKEQTDENKH